MGKLRIVFVLGVRMVGGRMVLGRRKVKENNEGWDGNRWFDFFVIVFVFIFY